MGGSRAAAPVAKDVLTYLFDKPKAMEALLELEKGWGGTIGERMDQQMKVFLARKEANDRAKAQSAQLADPRRRNGTT
jgi:penicillin-binding protein 2